MIPSGLSPRLHPEDVQLIAEAVVALLRSEPLPEAPKLISAREVAQRFGLSASWVYDNSAVLGAIRIGDGPRPRLRFDPAEVARRLSACSVSKGSEEGGTAGRAKPRRRAAANGQNGAALLPITPSRGAR